jgi:hypothetical protein
VTREPDPTGFDAIVAAWRAEGNVPQWPDDPQLEEMAADARTGVDTDAPADPAGAERPDESAGDRSDTDGPRADPEPADDDPDRPDAGRVDPDRGDAGRVDPEPAGHGGAQRSGVDPHVEDVADRRGATGERGHPVRAGAAADPHADEHFVPPDPPPLPRMGPPILVGLTLIALGLVLVTFPGWVGVPQVYGLPLGLVAIAAGLGWLVLRLWPDPDDVPPPLYLDDPDDPDGGAVL